MDYIKTLYGFELRKILRRKSVWISMIIMVLLYGSCIWFEVIGSYYIDGVEVDSNYHYFQENKAYQKAMDGRLMDDDLLSEMQEAYGMIPEITDGRHYSGTEEYRIYARPYSMVFYEVGSMTGMSYSQLRQWKGGAEELYELLLVRQQRAWDALYLTPAEKEFWQEKGEEMKWPMEYRYIGAYERLFSLVYNVGLMLILLIAIGLSGLFMEEHVRKTDQLILSSKYGRHTIYWVKFAAGMSFAVAISLAFTVIAFLIAFAQYGADGFSAAIQLIDGCYSWQMSVGEAVLICYLMVIFAVGLTAAFVMMFSELIHSSIGTLGFVGGLVILAMFVNIPEHYRVLAQIWSYLPSVFVASWNIFSLRTVPLFGKLFTPWQIGPVLYILLGAVFALAGKKIYTRYQVGGR